MDSSVDPIEPYAALNTSERVNSTNRSKPDKDQKEFARTLKKKLRGADGHETTEDTVELSKETTPDGEQQSEPEEQDAEVPNEPTPPERRHVDLKA
jgi:hypothetical protein